MFALQYRGELPETVEAELEQLIAHISSWALVEHKEEGGHSDITADSLYVAEDTLIDGALTVGGSITALDEQIFLGNDFANRPSLKLDTGLRPGALRSAWRLMADYTPTPTTGGLSFIDLTAFGGSGTEVMRLEPDPAGPAGIAYRLIPGGTLILSIGDNDAGPANVITSINASNINALGGYVERFRTVALGAWVTRTYNAADFTADAGATWGVDSADVVSLQSTLVGKTMYVSFDIRSTDVSGGPPTALQIALGQTVAKNARTTFIYSDAGGATAVGQAVVTASGTTLNLFKLDASAWTATAGDNTTVLGQIFFEIV